MVTGCNLTKNDGSPSIVQTRYKSLIGRFQYLMHTRPNIANVVGTVASYQADHKESHLVAVKRIFKYLKGTLEFGLQYDKSNDFTLYAYTYADWEGNIDDK